MRSRLLLIALTLCATAWGQEIVLDLDPATTTIHYTLPGSLHTVHGTFKLKRGGVHYDPATGKIGGEVVVDATSGDSQSEGRDHRMHKDIIESAKYPDIVFAPDRIDGTVAPQGESQVQVHGTFRMHGAAHEITVPVKVQVANGKATASAHFTIPYVKWGIKNPSNFLLKVSDKVDIDAASSALR